MEISLDFLVLGAVALLSGSILGYIGKIWRWAYWSARIPLDIMQILIDENQRNRGLHFKFQEDKVDPLNPSMDSGMLINKSWSCSYNTSGKAEEKSQFSFFGSSDIGDLTYHISATRIYRNKLCEIIDRSMVERNTGRQDKIFIVTTSSIYFVGDIKEEYTELPRVIEERLNGERTSRLNIFLHGPLGSGKTTLARAIAQNMKMPIYILALNSWWDMTDFVRALQRIPDDSVILFDDLDLTLEQLLRADVDKNNSPLPLKFSTASIMAFLDGIFMKQKRWIVIMCTNEPEKVRRLLRLRPGRVHIDFACTQVHATDYIEAAQEAKQYIDKFKREAEEKKGESTVEAPKIKIAS